MCKKLPRSPQSPPRQYTPLSQLGINPACWGIPGVTGRTTHSAEVHVLMYMIYAGDIRLMIVCQSVYESWRNLSSCFITTMQRLTKKWNILILLEMKVIILWLKMRHYFYISYYITNYWTWVELQILKFNCLWGKEYWATIKTMISYTSTVDASTEIVLPYCHKICHQMD